MDEKNVDLAARTMNCDNISSHRRGYREIMFPLVFAFSSEVTWGDDITQEMTDFLRKENHFQQIKGVWLVRQTLSIDCMNINRRGDF